MQNLEVFAKGRAALDRVVGTDRLWHIDYIVKETALAAAIAHGNPHKFDRGWCTTRFLFQRDTLVDIQFRGL
jgi:hypothetical protein